MPPFADAMQGTLLGPAFSDDEIAQWVEESGSIAERVARPALAQRVARMLADCDRDGYSESFLIAPPQSWTIKNGRFSGTKVQTVDKAKATVTFMGRISGGKVTGSIREIDSVSGNGIVCDTLVRKFTAKRR